jgi:type I restriction enzyme M protein
MNMFLHGVDDAEIERGDTLANPLHLENDDLKKFQVVVANPPFSLDKWAQGFDSASGSMETAKDGKSKDKFKMEANLDPFKRFDWGVPPTSKGDYAFVLHMIHSMSEDDGRMAVVLPHGILFRGASEGVIRRRIIEQENLLDAVIGLPENLFFGTGIPACIMVLKKNRKRNTVLIIDASKDTEGYDKEKNQNRLNEKGIQRIIETYDNYQAIDKYSYVATIDEIRENDFNLNIPRYVDTFEEEELVDMETVKENIKHIEMELQQVQAQMAKYLEELKLN